MVRFQSLVKASFNRWPDEDLVRTYYDHFSGLSEEDIVDTAIQALSSSWASMKNILRSSILEEKVESIKNMLTQTQGLTQEQADDVCKDDLACRKILVRIVVSQAIEDKYKALFDEICQNDDACAKFQAVMDKFVDKIMEN